MVHKTFFSAALLTVCFTGCAGLNGSGSSYDPYYDRSPYDRGYYDDDYYRRRERERISRERYELERERDRLEDERRRAAEERYRDQTPLRPAIPPRLNEECPPGFAPRDARCSDAERRRGCKDIRLPSGQGCVKR